MNLIPLDQAHMRTKRPRHVPNVVNRLTMSPIHGNHASISCYIGKSNGREATRRGERL